MYTTFDHRRRLFIVATFLFLFTNTPVGRIEIVGGWGKREIEVCKLGGKVAWKVEGGVSCVIYNAARVAAGLCTYGFSLTGDLCACV